MTGLLVALTLLGQPPVAGAAPLTAREATVLAMAFGERAPQMARIAYRESRYVDDATEGGRYRGWFQIDTAHLDRPGVAERLGFRAYPGDLDNPLVNALVAAWLLEQRSDYGDWEATR